MEALPPEKTELVLRLLRYFFHRKFVLAENIAAEQQGQVLPLYFVSWLDSQINLWSRDDECQAAEVESWTWDFVIDNILAGGAGVERIQPLWYAVCLSERPMPVHRLQSIALSLLLTYQDGTRLPIQVFCTTEMIPGCFFNDAIAACLIANRVRDLLQQIVDNGLDGLYHQGVNLRGGPAMEDPFDVWMGRMPHMLAELPQEYRKPIHDYIRMVQGWLRPAIPPGALAAIAAARQQAAGEPAGGWDV